jgi:molybdopterin/thiamine biosynthesis adenylyltransferase
MATEREPEADRYSRQARFAGVGQAGQERLRAGSAVVIGCGALGAASLDLLARAGVGHLVAVDRDLVELSNLQRQLLYDESDAAAGLPKAIAAAQALARINSEVEVRPVVADVVPANVERLVAGADVVLDGTDNLETRYLLNDACVKLGIPWIYGGAIGATGMSVTILPGETPCFRCVFPRRPPPGAVATCDAAGVIGSIVAAVGAIQFTEAVKILIGARQDVNRGLVALDLWTHQYERGEPMQRDPACPCCAGRRFDYLEARATARTASLCGRNAMQVSPAEPVKLDLAELGRRLAAVGAVTASAYLVRVAVTGHELTVFADGRAIVKGTTDEAVARSLYARYVGT